MVVDMSEENDREFAAHVQTYHAFVKLLTYAIAGMAVLLVLMAKFLL